MALNSRWLLSRRAANSLGAALMAAMLLYALFTQYVQGLQPCNMCLLQRLAVAVVGTLFLLAAIYHPRVALARVYAVLMGVGASAGVSLAARQVWMQAQPLGSLPSCGADLYTLMDLLPVHQAVLLVWNGGGDCQAVTWSLWGLSMAGWVAISLSIIGILGILNNIRHD